jgi:hypothetical protein
MFGWSLIAGFFGGLHLWSKLRRQQDEMKYNKKLQKKQKKELERIIEENLKNGNYKEIPIGK